MCPKINPARPSLTSINTYTSLMTGANKSDHLKEETEDSVTNDNLFEEEAEVTTEFRVPLSGQQQNLFIVHNEIQSSSCVLFHWQFLENTPENSALIEAFFHLVREKLISHMKNTVRSVHYYC